MARSDGNDPQNDSCEACGGALRWERLEQAGSERWLGVCECGSMRAFLPDKPAVCLDDPLAAFLRGVGDDDHAYVRPPWVRLVRVSTQWPWRVSWAVRAKPCTACSVAVVLTVRRPPWVRSTLRASLCAACGEVTIARTDGRVAADGWLRGNRWAPACPAVVHLRETVFSSPCPPLFSAFYTDGEDE